ncbi:MAG: tRNA (adenosine(37)-N6)-threonylcarbamoyltransferase complex ATPase subunit type 1 TsaE [Acidimicrobiia bacterium]
MKVRTTSAIETEDVAETVGVYLRGGDVVVLSGDLGAGKTTFTKGLARGLGVRDTVVSPTFTIVREYEGRIPLAHLDVYRLDRFQELHDVGIDELVDEHRVTVVEWGDAVRSALPADRLEVSIELPAVPSDSDDERIVTISARGSSWTQRFAALEASVRAERIA